MRLKVFIIVLLSLFASNVMAEELAIPENKMVIQFETKLGIVTFAHLMHAGLSITQCTTCHHDLLPADTLVKACHECHQHKSKKPAKTKIAFHDRCTGCHEYTVAGGQNAGPLKKKCKLCHIKPPKD
ncbi:MAG: hypothetical protein GQ550_03295 [Gammaproteobacteria bacterium]|nr:hypothetical protein [Gammaproteobacteria bacterium]